MSDQILRELWAIKNQVAQECGYDLRRLFQHLKSLQAASSRPVVNRTTVPKDPTTRGRS